MGKESYQDFIGKHYEGAEPPISSFQALIDNLDDETPHSSDQDTDSAEATE